MVYTGSDGEPRGWCRACDELTAAVSVEEFICPACESSLLDPSELDPRERGIFDFMEWMRGVYVEGKWGPSPGEATGQLRCSRAMIDKLAQQGVLDRSEYDQDGHFVIMIGQESIDRAKAHKKRTGRWTPLPNLEEPES